MMQYLQEELCSNEIFDVDSLGWRGDLVEAECFAFLAVRCCTKNSPHCLPQQAVEILFVVA